MDIHKTLLELAPENLKNYRSLRYDGAGFDVPLERFAAHDQTIMARLYAGVQDLCQLWQGMINAPDYLVLETYLRRLGDGQLLAEASRLGQATEAAGLEDAKLKKVAHDVRGGGLMIVLGSAYLLDLMPGDRSIARNCVEAARDHAKIMRNLLPNIDAKGRETDELNKAHSVEYFVSKWQGMTSSKNHEPVTVRVHCSFNGNISARCLETSSIDRIVYNYMNNAVRFTSTGEILLWIFPVGQNLTRWVIQNRISDDQSAFLDDKIGSDFGKLFGGGITRGGTGVGLTNCAEIVADCFGLPSPIDAVREKYLGATILGNNYYAWFHWPAYSAS